jgi:AraC-like DNA-binding protein
MGERQRELLERVRMAIQQERTGRRPAVEDIADVLHIRSRALHRHLKEGPASNAF